MQAVDSAACRVARSSVTLEAILASVIKYNSRPQRTLLRHVGLSSAQRSTQDYLSSAMSIELLLKTTKLKTLEESGLTEIQSEINQVEL